MFGFHETERIQQLTAAKDNSAEDEAGDAVNTHTGR